jgi:hypothetical protein
MPCKKCEEGKYKWGETGECQYDSLDACESANHKYKMQPTPLGKTYEEYAKELKEFNLSKVERVELTLVGDLEKESTIVKNQLKKMTKTADDYLAAKKEAISERAKSENINDNSFKIIDKIVSAAKELGVKPKDIPAYMELRKAQDQIIKEFQRVPFK